MILIVLFQMAFIFYISFSQYLRNTKIFIVLFHFQFQLLCVCVEKFQYASVVFEVLVNLDSQHQSLCLEWKQRTKLIVSCNSSQLGSLQTLDFLNVKQLSFISQGSFLLLSLTMLKLIIYVSCCRSMHYVLASTGLNPTQT